jgi:hypothetical protein
LEEGLDHRHEGVVMTGTRRLSASKSKSLFALLAAVGALAATCSKAPAEAALKAADQAVASARTEGEKFAPEQLEALMDAAKSAHEKFDHRDYAAAKASADAVVAEAQDVEKAAAAQKEEVTKAWGDLQAQVPAMGDTIRARVDELAAMKKLPKGFDVERLEDAKAGLAAFDQAWGGAAAAAQSGDVISAVEKGRATRGKALELINALGLPSPAVAASEPPPPATK